MEIILSDANFDQEVLKSDLPVLVDFWAPWCGPCRMVAPLIGKIAREYEGKIKVGKLNTDENVEKPTIYGIRGIPTLIIFKAGEEAERVVGAVSEAELENVVKRNIS